MGESLFGRLAEAHPRAVCRLAACAHGRAHHGRATLVYGGALRCGSRTSPPRAATPDARPVPRPATGTRRARRHGLGRRRSGARRDGRSSRRRRSGRQGPLRPRADADADDAHEYADASSSPSCAATSSSSSSSSSSCCRRWRRRRPPSAAAATQATRARAGSGGDGAGAPRGLRPDAVGAPRCAPRTAAAPTTESRRRSASSCCWPTAHAECHRPPSRSSRPTAPSCATYAACCQQTCWATARPASNYSRLTRARGATTSASSSRWCARTTRARPDTSSATFGA